MPDAELLARCVRDPELFGVFYRRHSRRIMAYLVRRTDCPQTASDLAAETFAAAFVKRGKFRDMGRPAEAWLIGIARNQLGSYARKERVSRKYQRKLGMTHVEFSPDEYERITDLAELDTMRDRLRDAMTSLPAGQAEAVTLRVINELPYADVAQQLGIKEGTARVRVSRGLTHLADILETA